MVGLWRLLAGLLLRGCKASHRAVVSALLGVAGQLFRLIITLHTFHEGGLSAAELWCALWLRGELEGVAIGILVGRWLIGVLLLLLLGIALLLRLLRGVRLSLWLLRLVRHLVLLLLLLLLGCLRLLELLGRLDLQDFSLRWSDDGLWRRHHDGWLDVADNGRRLGDNLCGRELGGAVHGGGFLKLGQIGGKDLGKLGHSGLLLLLFDAEGHV